MCVMSLKIAFVGLGKHMRQSHVRYLKDHPDCEIAGAFDPSPASFDAVKEEEGIVIKPYDSYEAVLSDSEVDAVMIGTPDRFHTPQLVAAVQNKKHVFCEKPLCTSTEEYNTLKDAFEWARDTSVIVTSCHPRRFDPPYQYVQKNIPQWEKELGELINVELDFSYHGVGDKGHIHGNSLLQDHANHEIDFVNWILGSSETEVWKLSDSADRYQMSGKRKEDDVTFLFSGTRRLDSHIFPESMRLRFSKGTVNIDTKHTENSYIHHHETGKMQFLNGAAPVTDYPTRFGDMNKHWVKLLQGKEKNYLTPDAMLTNSLMSVCLHDQDHVVVQPQRLDL